MISKACDVLERLEKYFSGRVVAACEAEGFASEFLVIDVEGVVEVNTYERMAWRIYHDVSKEGNS